MGKKGGTKHLKTKMAPTFWPVHRKDKRWVVKPASGPHRSTESLPLLIILREILGLGKTRREIGVLLSQGNVKVDGITRKNDDFPIGLMDIIEIPVLNKVYRLLPLQGKELKLHEVPKEEREFKLCKIIGKTTIRGGHFQLNLTGGRNIVMKVVDPRNPSETLYKTGDLLRISIPQVEVLAHLPFEKGVLALIDGGDNAGQWGEVVNINPHSIYGSTVTIRNAEDEEVETISDYIFPIGKGDAWISLPGGAKQ